MIIDAVENHESLIPGERGWEAAAALLAAICLWAKINLELKIGTADGLTGEAIEELGSVEPPSEWVSRHLDFVVTDALFNASAANFLTDFVASGGYYDLVRKQTGGDLYALSDTWSAFGAIAEAVQRSFELWR